MTRREYLEKQGRRDFADDYSILNNVLDEFYEPHVLDIGCGYGNVAFDLLSGRKYTYVGVEKDPEAAGIAAATFPNDTVFCGDIYDPELFKKVKNQGSYDLIMMSQVIMHVEDPVLLLSRVKDLLHGGGVLYIKVVEDGLKTCYPGKKLLDAIIKEYQKCLFSMENVYTDRFCGHKVYHYLYEAGFTKIKHKIVFCNTVGKSLSERMEQYEMCFSYRIREEMPEDYKSAMAVKLWKMKQLFKNEDFYFASPTLYYTATL